MSDAPLWLRLGTKDDVDRVFEWANDPVTRQVSFNTEPIAYDQHVAWFERQLTGERQNLFIIVARALDDEALPGEPLGVVRLDALQDLPTACVVSINVAPQARGRGVGGRALAAATEAAIKLGFDTIDAYIRPSNVASVRAFEKAGYKLSEPHSDGHDGGTAATNEASVKYVLALAERP